MRNVKCALAKWKNQTSVIPARIDAPENMGSVAAGDVGHGGALTHSAATLNRNNRDQNLKFRNEIHQMLSAVRERLDVLEQMAAEHDDV